MIIRELNLTEIAAIFKEHMLKDFPADEIKPLDVIELAYREGKYSADGAFDENGELMAYAFWVRVGQKLLLDYYAVVSTMRSSGIGTAVLERLLPAADAEMLLIEIEDPDADVTDAEKQIRNRRRAFYERVGCINTNTKGQAFGVDFWLLEYTRKEAHSKQEIIDGYKELYKAILPPTVFENEIFAWDDLQ